MVSTGEVFSVSLAQGGPAPCFFRNWCYQFLAAGDFDALQLTKDDVDDLEYALLIERVEAATDLTQLTDEIVSCGYTGLLKMDRKDSIIRAIVLTPMLQQIRNGMKIYNLLNVIGKHHTLCSNPFVPKQDNDSQNEDQKMCEPLTQEKLLSEGHWNQQKHASLSVPTVMQWLTGQRHKPLLPSERADFKINPRFEHPCNEKMPGHHICFPLVSACTNTITIPVEHMKTYRVQRYDSSNQNGLRLRSCVEVMFCDH